MTNVENKFEKDKIETTKQKTLKAQPKLT